MSKVTIAAAVEVAKEFVEFVNAAVTPFHAVATIEAQLRNAGYTKLYESAPWPALPPGGKFYVTRNSSSIVAFAVGGKFSPVRGFKIVGGHTDSPNLQLKPKAYLKKGVWQGVGVQCYGGGLWHTWFDRELTVAGRLLVSESSSTPPRSVLVRIPKPLMRIPTLAIHLRSQAERDAFSFNKETQLVPLLATELAINEATNEGEAAEANLLMSLLAKEANCKPKDIVDFDLSVVDHQPATVGGALDEFVFAPRIDNLASCFCAIRALLEADVSLETEESVRMVALFDHEEVGSESAQGAGGTLITDLVERLCAHDPIARTAATANSFLLSVDCAHAAHPNYMDKHENEHRPELHKGPVVKYNANVRYATNGSTGAILKSLAGLAEIPVQQFCVRNDSPCGSTIGPILSTLSGIQAADIGNPMLSMHSIREQCGTVDLLYMQKLLTTFFARLQDVRYEV